MKAFVWLLLASLFSISVHAEENSDAPLADLDPAYKGVHGMYVFNLNSALYASHLPSYRKPHNAQIIYKLEAKDPALIYLVRDADMVTIKPETFNLQKLIRGEELSVKADVYIGHYERSGSLIYEQIQVTFTKQLYVRMLEDLGEPSTLQVYDQVELKSAARLFIHQIQGSPSYDHLLLIYEDIGCITNIDTGNPVPSETLLINKLSYCGSMRPLYYESRDFAEGGIHTSGN